MMTDHQIIFLKLWVNKLAVICGKVSREMASTIPTMRRHDTMVSAMNIIRIYSNKATGIRWERANSRSKAMQMIGFRNNLFFNPHLYFLQNGEKHVPLQTKETQSNQWIWKLKSIL